MAGLRRICAGSYTQEQAVPLQQLVDSAHPQAYLLPVDSMFLAYPRVILTPKQELRCRNGNRFSVSLPEGFYRAYSQGGEFLMLAQVQQGEMSTVKSFFSL